MDADIWNRAFYDDGEWVSWADVEVQLRYQEWRAKYPNAIRSLIPYFEELLSLAESYHLETGRHLVVYGVIGELFGAITYGIKLNRNYAQGADGRLGDDHVEIKTITPTGPCAETEVPCRVREVGNVESDGHVVCERPAGPKSLRADLRAELRREFMRRQLRGA